MRSHRCTSAVIRSTCCAGRRLEAPPRTVGGPGLVRAEIVDQARVRGPKGNLPRTLDRPRYWKTDLLAPTARRGGALMSARESAVPIASRSSIVRTAARSPSGRPRTISGMRVWTSLSVYPCPRNPSSKRLSPWSAVTITAGRRPSRRSAAARICRSRDPHSPRCRGTSGAAQADWQVRYRPRRAPATHDWRDASMMIRIVRVVKVDVEEERTIARALVEELVHALHDG